MDLKSPLKKENGYQFYKHEKLDNFVFCTNGKRHAIYKEGEKYELVKELKYYHELQNFEEDNLRLWK